MLLCISPHSSHLPYTVIVLCSTETAAVTLEHSPLCCDCSSTDDMKDNICFVLKYVDIFHTCELLLCCDTHRMYVERRLYEISNLDVCILHWPEKCCVLCESIRQRRAEAWRGAGCRLSNKWKWDGRATIKLISFWLPFIFPRSLLPRATFQHLTIFSDFAFIFFFIAIKFFLFLISVLSGRSTQRNDVEFIFAWEMFFTIDQVFPLPVKWERKLLIKKRMTEVHNHTICGG